MKKVISLYCDESCHLKNNGEHVTMIGYLGVPHNRIKEYKEGIKKIREEHKLFTEVKWNKISNSKASFYNALIDYYIDSEMIFRGLIIPSGVFKRSHLEEDDYYKMFFKLLSHEVNLNYTYNIYIDRKDSHSPKKVAELKERLIEHIPLKFNNVQCIHSHESSFIQLADIIIGAIASDLNNSTTSLTKQVLIRRLVSRFKDDGYESYKAINADSCELYSIAQKSI